MSGPMQFLNGQMVPVGTDAVSQVPTQSDDDFMRSLAPRPHVVMPQAPAPVVLKKTQAPTPLTPKNVLALAKARLREVKKELHRMKSLEQERGELERLIAAAENKPPRVVAIHQKRTAG